MSSSEWYFQSTPSPNAAELRTANAFGSFMPSARLCSQVMAHFIALRWPSRYCGVRVSGPTNTSRIFHPVLASLRRPYLGFVSEEASPRRLDALNQLHLFAISSSNATIMSLAQHLPWLSLRSVQQLQSLQCSCLTSFRPVIFFDPFKEFTNHHRMDFSLRLSQVNCFTFVTLSSAIGEEPARHL